MGGRAGRRSARPRARGRSWHARRPRRGRHGGQPPGAHPGRAVPLVERPERREPVRLGHGRLRPDLRLPGRPRRDEQRLDLLGREPLQERLLARLVRQPQVGRRPGVDRARPRHHGQRRDPRPDRRRARRGAQPREPHRAQLPRRQPARDLLPHGRADRVDGQPHAGAGLPGRGHRTARLAGQRGARAHQLHRLALQGRVEPGPGAGPRRPRRRLHHRPVEHRRHRGEPHGEGAARLGAGRRLDQRAGPGLRRLLLRALEHRPRAASAVRPHTAARLRAAVEAGRVRRAGHPARRPPRAARRHDVGRAAVLGRHAHGVRRLGRRRRHPAGEHRRRLPQRRLRLRPHHVGPDALRVVLHAALRAGHPHARALRPHVGDLVRPRTPRAHGLRLRRLQPQEHPRRALDARRAQRAHPRPA